MRKEAAHFSLLVPVRDSQSLPPAAQMKFQLGHPLRFLMKNYKSISSGQEKRKAHHLLPAAMADPP